jgi:hypothetical protein
MKIQDFRRSFRPINNSIRLPKGRQDVGSFHIFQRGEF